MHALAGFVLRVHAVAGEGEREAGKGADGGQALHGAHATIVASRRFRSHGSRPANAEWPRLWRPSGQESKPSSKSESVHVTTTSVTSPAGIEPEPFATAQACPAGAPDKWAS